MRSPCGLAPALRWCRTLVHETLPFALLGPAPALLGLQAFALEPQDIPEPRMAPDQLPDGSEGQAEITESNPDLARETVIATGRVPARSQLVLR